MSEAASAAHSTRINEIPSDNVSIFVRCSELE
jgi:hypothetical protein